MILKKVSFSSDLFYKEGGLPIDVDFSVNYVNFDKFLFYSKGESYSNSQTAKFFKILLSDNDLRNRRNNELFKFVKSKDSLIKVINNIYDNNHIVMLHSGRSRRAFNFQKMQQIKILETTLDLANQYLNYSHIYSTYDVFTKDFEILSDAFSSIKIIKNDSVIASQLNGISLKNNLEFNYSYKKFKIKNFSEDDFISVHNNHMQKEDHIFFNYHGIAFKYHWIIYPNKESILLKVLQCASTISYIFSE